MRNIEDLRIPPHSPEAELAVLQAMFIDPVGSIGKAQGKKLRPAMFYDTRHKMLCDSLYEMAKDGRGMDALTITEWLKDRNETERIGYDVLASIMQSNSLAENVGPYSEIVIEKYLRRKVIEISINLMDEAYAGEKTGQELIQDIPRLLAPIMSTGGCQKTNKEILDAWYDRMVAIKKGEITNGLPLPWPALDDLMCGLEPGLIIVGAEKSGGKTTFELNLCDHLARNGCPIGRAGLDMSVESLLCRSVVREARISLPRLKHGHAKWNQMATVKECKNLIATWPYYIIETGTVAGICQEARMLKIKHDIQLLTVDFMQLVVTDDGRIDSNMNMLMGVVTRTFKALAFELDIPVILLSQFSRAIARPNEKRRRPVLTDLRDSGNIEQNATQVILLSKALPEDFPAIAWDENGNDTEWLSLPPDAEKKYYRPIIADLAKNQNGETGEIPLVLAASYFRLDEAETGYKTMAADLLRYERETIDEEAQSSIPGARVCDGDDDFEVE